MVFIQPLFLEHWEVKWPQTEKQIVVLISDFYLNAKNLENAHAYKWYHLVKKMEIIFFISPQDVARKLKSRPLDWESKTKSRCTNSLF